MVTIVFANRYASCNELKTVGAGEPGRNARRMLDLDDPSRLVHRAKALA